MQYFVKQLKYTGFLFSNSNIKKDHKRISAILNLTKPELFDYQLLVLLIKEDMDKIKNSRLKG